MPIRPENKSLYPPDWPEISDRIRFGRAKGQCEFEDDGVRCQARHHAQHPITGSTVILTTAHLNHDPSDCREENLRAGCQMHHNRYDREHRNETRKRILREQKNTIELFQNLD